MEKKTRSTGLRILLAIVSALLCLLLILGSVVTMAIADVRIITSKDNLQKIINQAIFTSAPARPTVPMLAAGAALSPAERTGENPLQDAVVDAIYELVVGQSGTSLGVSRSQISALLNQSTVSDFLSEKIAAVISDVYTGQATATLTRAEVETLLQENADVIEDIFHITVNPEKIDEVASYVERHDVMGAIRNEVNAALGIDPSTPSTDSGSSGTSGSTDGSETVPSGGTETNPSGGTETNPSGGATENTTPTEGETVPQEPVPGDKPAPANPIAAALNALRTYTSIKALVLAITVCVVLAGLLFLTNWGKPFAAMVWIGTALLIAALPYVTATVFSSAIPGLLAGFSGWLAIAGKLAQTVLQMVLPVSLGVLLFGIALMVCGIVFGKLAKKKALKA